MAKLAINGGEKIRNKGFTGWPVYGQGEQLALDRVLKSGQWGTLGKEVEAFVERFKNYQQSKFGLAVTNGTVTMEIALRAMGVGHGDEVIVPPFTFIATVSAVVMTGATPVFADIEEGTFNLDPNKLEQVITPKTKAMIPVHIGGRMCNMDELLKVADKHGLAVIEDCAHAHGSEWDRKRAGSIGNAGSFSFQASKNLTAGEGGFITTNDEALYATCWGIHHCGRAYKGTVWYDHPMVGTNARMTEWQAAILNAQMERLDEQILKRMDNAAHLEKRLSSIDCITTLDKDKRVTRNSYHLFLFKYHEEKNKGVSRDSFVKALAAEGIPASRGYFCLYKMPMFQTDEFRKMTGSKIQYDELSLPFAEVLTEKQCIWMPQSPFLGSFEDMDTIADAIEKIVENVDELL